MPAQTSKVSNPIAAIVKAHAGDKVDYGQDFSSLPGGITGGVAELIECKTARYKKGDNVGKPYFTARGTVIRPLVAVETVSKFEKGKVVIVSQQEVSVKGRQTRCGGGPIALCQTQTKSKPPKVTTVEDAYVTVINELKKLGGEECTLSLGELPADATEAQVLAAIDEIGKALVDARVRFKFNTRQGNPSADYPNNPRVFEEWKGAVSEEEGAAEAGGGVADETGQQEEAQPESAEAPQAEAPADEQEDLAELAASADAKDNAAQKRLTELATEAGIDVATIEGVATWQELADLVVEAQGGGAVEEVVEETTEEVVEEPEPWKPAVGEQYDHFPMVKNKAGKSVRATKAVACVVTAVDEDKQTLSLKNGKTEYKGLKWSLFEPKE